MDLRPRIRAWAGSHRLPGLAMGAAAAAAALVALLAGGALAGSSDYPTPLYLSGTSSGLLGSGFKLVGTTGVSATARPTPVATPCAGCAGLLGAGVLTSYSYVYTLVDANGETAPSLKATASVKDGTITVSGLPTGITVRLYRQKAGTPYKRVAEFVTATGTYTDNIADGSLGVILPQAQNRTDLNFSGLGGITGYFEYAPGNAIPDGNASGAFGQVAAPAFDGKGWVVDAPGSVSFASGTWTVKVKITSSGSGTGRFVTGMWKVDGSGAVVGSPLIDPTCTASCASGGAPGESATPPSVTNPNISTGAGTAAAFTMTFAAVPAISLAAGEHLYLQFWRHQTAGSNGNTISTLSAYDGVNQITHPAANAFPNDPTLQSPADGSPTSSAALSAGYSDPDNDAGTVDFRVCTTAAAAGSQCSGLVTSTGGTPVAVASGANASWTPTLADGTYYWQAHANDSAGNQSAWTATRSFTLDTTPPTVTLQTPADAALTNAQPTLAATFGDVPGDSGTVDFQVCSDAACSSIVTSATSATVASGANATWSPTLADGAYYWRGRPKDAAGNQPASWSATRSFTLDTTPPVTTRDSQPAALVSSASATFTFHANEGGSTFQCQLDGGGYGVCTSPKSYSGLADGGHTFDVRATDPAGNTGSAVSYPWTVDTTPPVATITSQPAALSNSTAPSFGFTSNEPGSSFQCKLDGGAYGACASPTSYSGLTDGSHTFSVKATDPAGNVGTAASYTWTIDTVAPVATITAKPLALGNSNAPSFSFTSSKAGSTFECRLDGAAYAACSSPKSYSGVADGSHTFDVRTTDPAGNVSAPASASWTIDTVAPVVTITAQPPALTNATAASFSFSADKAGSTFQCQLDGGAYSACTSPKSYSGLANGSHTFDVKATDPAGNTSVPATWTWTVDTAAPVTTITAQPAALTNSSAPAFSFSSNKAGSTFQCQVDGGGFSACSSPKTYAGLADGNHTFQVKATDPAGNTGSAASAGWTSDTAAPSTPALVTPADGARTNGRSLAATYSDAGSSGKLVFRLCTDSGCGSAIAAWVSPVVSSGTNVSWAIPGTVPEGVYYWQAYAADAAGNQSGWATTRTFTLDTTPPGAPGDFAGTVHGLPTLSWSAPEGGDPIGSYVIYINGVRAQSVDGATTHVDLGGFLPDDARVFSVAAVDTAGNEGPRSGSLVGVPNLTGLKPAEASAALAARGLVLGERHGPPAGLVSSQDPAAPALVSPGASVAITLTKPQGGPDDQGQHGQKGQPSGHDQHGRRVLSIVIVGEREISCLPNAHLTLQIGLSAQALVSVRFLSLKGVPLATQRLGVVRAGASSLSLRLPSLLARPGRYRVIVLATLGDQIVRAEMRFSLAKLRSVPGAKSASCGLPGA